MAHCFDTVCCANIPEIPLWRLMRYAESALQTLIWNTAFLCAKLCQFGETRPRPRPMNPKLISRKMLEYPYKAWPVGHLTHDARQVLHSAKLKDVTSAQSASAWYFSAILKAFLKSKTKVRSAMRKFLCESTEKTKFSEPIFFLSLSAKGWAYFSIIAQKLI